MTERALEETRAWVERVVIGLDLCPFAKAPHKQGRVRFVLSEARDAEALLATLVEELNLLAQTPPERTETTLIVHPHVLADFADYNDFLGIAEDAVAELGLEGVIQVASFHPRYRFADTSEDDVTNATNRSPHPTLHLLREESVERAVAAFPEAEAIWEANVETMRRLGSEGWEALQREVRAAARS
jgi:hypothetical protein